MKETDMTMHFTISRFSLVLGMALFFIAAWVHAKDAPPSLEGIHVHRSGTSPYFLHAAQESIKTYEGQCKMMKSICAMMPKGASAKDKAACANVSGGFSLKGNLADVGKQETDEYFATAMNMAARQTTKTVLHVKSLCEVEVVERKGADIWHYATQGHTHYELKDHPEKGRYWIRSEHKNLAPKAGALLAGVFPLSDASKVSPVLSFKTIAGHKCEVREIAGPWSGTFCLKVTPTAFPGHVTLAGKVVAGKDTMLEDQATDVAEKVMLPRDYFYPPEQDKVESMRTLSKSPGNATQKWCAKQKIKTGINPCEKDADDGK
ncbi:MAG: hypothetical protein Q8K52_03580 [Thiobacillus sp.]|nr:hypothetical protein [Thiobacillus sp.]